ncbi:acyl-CoA thioesterase II [Lichenibacterium minor]|jgi:acyl-CoA thioesterase-2|uniref:Acyl-CoA thioesterase 2 n=1 Tax=Lichenibacterium minor TaxID=2316528 RepID=A0A4Q2U536_9HYPH|nr:acyl-CoA thioesterase II [Lichenibacterium minor]RYC30037.1 acyl-CoA thioesterase II [Lichenibacterium minor]
MAVSLADLVATLDLAPAGEDRFSGLSPATGWRRIFGGLVVAQALVAMTRTAGNRPVHSLHGYFMLPGDPEEPIGYAVERLRDGGSFTTRRCVASQHGRPIFAMSASFHAPEPGALDHAAPMPDAPAPETLPSPDQIRSGLIADLPPSVRAYFGRDASIELRPADAARFARRPPGPHPARQSVWMRAAGTLPDDPALHAALLAYMSDMTLLDTALAAHGRSVFDPDIQGASLDHSMWFHRPFRADDWLLYAEDSPSAAGALGFARGSVFDRSGRLVASTAQEGLIRRRDRG